MADHGKVPTFYVTESTVERELDVWCGRRPDYTLVQTVLTTDGKYKGDGVTWLLRGGKKNRVVKKIVLMPDVLLAPTRLLSVRDIGQIARFNRGDA